jgi:hypothetical protein
MCPVSDSNPTGALLHEAPEDRARYPPPTIATDGLLALTSERPKSSQWLPASRPKKGRGLQYGGRHRPVNLLALLPDQRTLRVGPDLAVHSLYKALAVLVALLELAQCLELLYGEVV